MAEAQRDIALRHQATAEAEQANAMKYAGMVATAKMAADNEAAKAVVTKAAGTKLTAMQAEAAQTTDAGLGGTGARTYSLSIERDRDGTEVKVTDSANAGKADPKFVDQMAGLGAGRFMLVRTMDADSDGNVVEEVVVVGIDIKAPTATAFANVTGQALNACDLDPGTDADEDGDVANDFTALTVVESDAAVVALVQSAAFPLGTWPNSTTSCAGRRCRQTMR